MADAGSSQSKRRFGFLRLAEDIRNDAARQLTSVSASTEGLVIEDMAGGLPPVPETVPATWDGLMATLARHYPPEVFVGDSDDPGSQIVALVRALDEMREGGKQLDGVIRRLSDENERMRDALDTIASGQAFGPQEVARVALGLKATPDACPKCGGRSWRDAADGPYRVCRSCEHTEEDPPYA